MSHVDELVRQAMALSDEDRAYVVTILERSLIGRGSATTGEPDLPSDAVTGEAFFSGARTPLCGVSGRYDDGAPRG